jgi:hypothetical protein
MGGAAGGVKGAVLAADRAVFAAAAGGFGAADGGKVAVLASEGGAGVGFGAGKRRGRFEWKSARPPWTPPSLPRTPPMPSWMSSPTLRTSSPKRWTSSSVSAVVGRSSRVVGSPPFSSGVRRRCVGGAASRRASSRQKREAHLITRPG